MKNKKFNIFSALVYSPDCNPIELHIKYFNKIYIIRIQLSAISTDEHMIAESISTTHLFYIISLIWFTIHPA
ncbi:hypothetical protein AQUCO_01800054v1 [Aquilegia coerulea]|uniref:Uncharacterized protein n=1 Tax=Aquilegia coerulea TaxID=218851 RepID=A0A2G5CU51_AQUCA|nr:hypothetical protein AQUCO_03700228v1 [Aquilegia coerulea]PIA37352.1 hypothetical protein AQUCO_03000150v1 [Aquilegia coerulea]PIA43729.1 hypothetical protein AQUCO_01800054v1 [Aquilegia coerulea]